MKALLEGHPELDVNGCDFDEGDEYAGVENGHTALHGASRHGYTEHAQLLIDHKADVNAKTELGSSSLHEAALDGHLSCVELLVQNGADVNCQEYNGDTPLLLCGLWGHLTTAHHLLDHKADVHLDTSEKDGRNKSSTPTTGSIRPERGLFVLSSKH
jgi:ankyrin repeat protein